MNRFLVFCSLTLLVLTSCNLFEPSAQAKLAIVSTSTSGSTLKALAQTSFTAGSTSPGDGFILSGAPDYLELTLKKIETFDTSTLVAGQVVWEGSKVLHLDGKTAIDTKGMTLSFVAGHVGTVRVTFDAQATIAGHLTGNLRTSTSNFNVDNAVTVYTKTAYPYSMNAGASTTTMGASAYSAYTTAPAEGVLVQLDTNTTTVLDTPANLTLQSGDAPTLTLLIDLSRLLRFYDGLNQQGGSHGGVNPQDPENTAYFFSHTVFGQSVAAFFGTPGAIQGYEAKYVAYEKPSIVQDLSTITTSGAVMGWATFIFDQSGNILAGALSGDDDNAYTVGKGSVGPVTQTYGAFEVPYALNPQTFTLHGFTKATTVGQGQYFRWESPYMSGAMSGSGGYRFGEVLLTLKYTSP